jgi:hypothetical protein
MTDRSPPTRLGVVPARYAARAGQAAVRYVFCIRGTLRQPLVGPLERMSVRTDGEESLLVGEVTDQTALQGVLRWLWDLGVEVVSFNPLDARAPDH